ncbi:MAG: fused MFS/spermidine synthase [Candidatus Riflebacteria bacterium]|nr:fused MFS/spermidine synthase [Candidatus Riflebacteria bacterium]
MNATVGLVSLLLFGSGMCGLMYQMVWFQDLRLVFGTSTAASAVVTAIFMGGLGLGSRLLGRVADRQANPLAWYGKLELGLAAAASLSPFLLAGVRSAYLALGGTLALGLLLGTVLRLALAMLVLAMPTVLMGGTFPAAARAVTGEADTGRWGLGCLYGANTLGGVAGVVLPSFLLFEAWGRQNTLWLAVGLNTAVALLALGLSVLGLGRQEPEDGLSSVGKEGRDGEAAGGSAPVPSGGNPARAAGKRPGARAADPAPAAAALASDPESPSGAADVALPAVPTAFAGGAAFLTGATFFLLEMVWYRLLSPVLGGSTYSFALVLATVLLGIGLGGFASLLRRPQDPPTLGGFAFWAAAGAAGTALPLALGDRVPVLAGLLQGLNGLGLAGMMAGWFVVTAVLVMPAALCSGVQFPLLLGLSGRGRQEVGAQAGRVYAWNTAGAITGSLAGGFGLLPALTAVGCWRLAGGAMVALAVAAAALGLRREGPHRTLVLSLPVAVLAVAMLGAPGPTAAWRHTAIGAGRGPLVGLSWNQIREWLAYNRRDILWEAEGVESSVALATSNGLAFKINGKCDGNSLGDASTQVMLGLLGAALHPAPQRAFVVGLGTGCTAGWLADVPGMERVDVVELEERVREVASRCTPINRGALQHPRLRLIIGDAREVLPTSPEPYDLIVSEPSNPFRAGIGSLYTREFYQAAAGRLRPGGRFAQWVQAYEIDLATMRTIYATLASVFPYVETWMANTGDLILVCSAEPPVIDLAALAARLAAEPFRTALWQAWRAVDIHGFLAHFLAAPAFATAIAEKETAAGGQPCTDDRLAIEYGLFRTHGATDLLSVWDLRAAAESMAAHRPALRGGEVDWSEVADHQLAFLTSLDQTTGRTFPEDTSEGRRLAAHAAFREGEFATFLRHWGKQERKPANPVEFAMLGEAFAYFGSEEALGMVEPIRDRMPGEAALIEARYWKSVGSHSQALDCLERAFTHFRRNPFPIEPLLRRGVQLAMVLALQDPARAPRAMDLLREPFLLFALDGMRRLVRAEIAMGADPPQAVEAFHDLEPNVPWLEKFLAGREAIYRKAQDPRRERAAADLDEFYRHQPNGRRRGILDE